MKKKKFYHALSLVTVAALSIAIIGCSPTVKSDSLQTIPKEIQVQENTIKVSEDYIEGEAKLPVISNLSDAKAQDKINATLKNDIMGFVDNQKDLTEVYKQNKDFTKLIISVDSKVTFKSDNLISMLISKKVKDEGNYSFENKTAYTFDLKTGKKVLLDKLISANEDYRETIKNYIEEKYEGKDNIRKFDVKDNQYYLGENKLFIFLREYIINEESKQNDEYEIPYEIFIEGVNLKPQLEPSVAEIESKKIKESNEYIEIDLDIPVVTGLKDEKFQEFINKRFEQDALKFKEEIEIFVKESHEDAKKEGYDLNKYSVIIDFEEKRNQENLLSIYVIYHQYTGGAHGIHNDVTYNIDLKTGNLVELKDLFKENVDYKKIIDSKIKEQINAINEDEKNFLLKAGQEENFYPLYEEFNGIKEDQTYYLTDDKLGIYFGLYEIAPYAAGVPTFEIPLEELVGYLNPIQ